MLGFAADTAISFFSELQGSQGLYLTRVHTSLVRDTQEIATIVLSSDANAGDSSVDLFSFGGESLELDIPSGTVLSIGGVDYPVSTQFRKGSQSSPFTLELSNVLVSGFTAGEAVTFSSDPVFYRAMTETHDEKAKDLGSFDVTIYGAINDGQRHPSRGDITQDGRRVLDHHTIGSDDDPEAWRVYVGKSGSGPGNR